MPEIEGDGIKKPSRYFQDGSETKQSDNNING